MNIPHGAVCTCLRCAWTNRTVFGHRNLDCFFGLVAAVLAGVILAAAFAFPSYKDDPGAYSIAYQVGVLGSIVGPALAVLLVGYRWLGVDAVTRRIREARSQARLAEWRRVSGCTCEAA